MRKLIIGGILGLAILALALFLFNTMAGSKQLPSKKKENQITSVYTKKVENGLVPLKLEASGQLLAQDRIELFAEVQGIMQPGRKPFKAGTKFQKGEILFKINAEVFEASVIAQKSTFQNLLTSILADLRLDYPESFVKWQAYVEQMDVRQPLPPLPEVSNKKEKLFLTGRNVYVSYFNLKNAELTLNKYQITAPFSGIVTESAVNPGTLVRPGQRLGTFISSGTFELETPINSQWTKWLAVGQEVTVYNPINIEEKWLGKVIRVNGAVDATTQTISAFIEVSGSGLAEGMYLSVSIAGKKIPNAFELPRSVLFEGNQVFLVENNRLKSKKIELVHFDKSTAVVKGLPQGAQVLIKNVPNAFDQMQVNPIKQKAS